MKSLKNVTLRGFNGEIEIEIKIEIKIEIGLLKWQIISVRLYHISINSFSKSRKTLIIYNVFNVQRTEMLFKSNY